MNQLRRLMEVLAMMNTKYLSQEEQVLEAEKAKAKKLELGVAAWQLLQRMYNLAERRQGTNLAPGPELPQRL